REFKVEINQGAPQVNYKETLTKPVIHRETYKKQSGGKGKFADIQFELMPAAEGQEEAMVFKDEIKGGSIPKEFIPAVKKGFEESMKNGVLAGFEIEQMQVRLFDGSFHAVDSDSLSFELAARMGFKAAGREAGAKLLEPVMAVEVVCPDESTGPVIGDMNRRRGMPKGQEARAGGVVIKADVPLSELFGYVTDLRTITSGRGSATLTFSHYAPVPENIAQEVIKERSK
ncbi:MAG: elongation factor G, partial [Bacteroidota bacterium]